MVASMVAAGMAVGAPTALHAMPPEDRGTLATDDTALSARVETVRKGDTLMTLLARIGVSRQDAGKAVAAMRPLYNPKDLKVGQTVTVTLDHGAPAAGSPGETPERQSLRGVILHASVDRDVIVERRTPTEGFESSLVEQALMPALDRRGGTIDSSLSLAGAEAGVPPGVMIEMIRNFSYDVDFQRDIQPDDEFELVYRQDRTTAGEIARTGHILYARLTLSGRVLEIFRFGDETDGADYFNRKGESVRKALLKTPVDGARITSGFGYRMHPILGYSILHRGVDFGVPQGTPVMAAGDGVIVRAAPFAGYGNYVRVRHNSEFDTAYAHLSRYANIHAGQHVRQGEVIGYVGMTGMATGPHLHYEVLRHDEQINPVSVHLPAGRKLDGAELKRFLATVEEIERQRRALPDPLVAMADPVDGGPAGERR